ncbi:MAG: YihA family ribosome biogenesis GTP-binding protein [Bacteroidetes bacterium GWF2_49_14]|nr:MAG: YihA family ribosome biogenesis GTP-binding protein [Bacteroidetes bacterium GWF2_49_14]HBB93350.1 YihA family ribosome biogenesis GTP-binding protein [Bacteroidales bacterium]
MVIKTAAFVASNTNPSKCPKPDKPEYAFIGRSNVGKSTLINLLTGRKALAKVSGSPGKTRAINHFIINDNWFLADLPGYGYAKVSKTDRKVFSGFTTAYLKSRENLMSLFVLIDSRLEPQAIDISFITFLGENQIPFVLVFTKTDKISGNQAMKNIAAFRKVMKAEWDELPREFLTSSVTGTGRDELLGFIQQTNLLFNHPGTKG